MAKVNSLVTTVLLACTSRICTMFSLCLRFFGCLRTASYRSFSLQRCKELATWLLITSPDAEGQCCSTRSARSRTFPYAKSGSLWASAAASALYMCHTFCPLLLYSGYGM